MPRLVSSSEKDRCAATIELDNGETCLISVAQAGVLVRSYKRGFFIGLFGSFFGPILYDQKNAYRVARTSAALDSKCASPELEVSESFADSFRLRRLALLVCGGDSYHA
jgi:hypothetical protein